MIGWNAPVFAYQEPDLGRNGLEWSAPSAREQPTAAQASILSSIVGSGQIIVFQRFGGTEVQLLQPIPLRIEREDAVFLVASDELDVFGTGDTPGAALEDFELTLRELVERLNEPDVQLGPALVALRDVVNAYVARPVPA